MGFINRLEQEKRDKDRLDTESERTRREQSERELTARKAAEEAKTARISAERRQAKEFMEKSRFPFLTQRLRSAVEGMWLEQDENSFSRFGQFSNTDESVDAQISVCWDSQFVWRNGGTSDQKRKFKKIEIMCYPDGTITVRGGLFGSTTLPLRKWENDPEAQEKALEKAYNHPKQDWEYLKQSGYGPGSNPGP